MPLETSPNPMAINTKVCDQKNKVEVIEPIDSREGLSPMISELIC